VLAVLAVGLFAAWINFITVEDHHP